MEKFNDKNLKTNLTSFLSYGLHSRLTPPECKWFFYWITKRSVCVAYLSLCPHWRCVKPLWIGQFWASLGHGTSSLTLRGSTFPPHWLAARCSSNFLLLSVLISLCTEGIWTVGNPWRTSGKTCDHRTWSPARTSGSDRADTPAAPWIYYVTNDNVPKKKWWQF